MPFEPFCVPKRPVSCCETGRFAKPLTVRQFRAAAVPSAVVAVAALPHVACHGPEILLFRRINLSKTHHFDLFFSIFAAEIRLSGVVRRLPGYLSDGTFSMAICLNYIQLVTSLIPQHYNLTLFISS